MSLRLEMLQVARLAPKVLGDSTELIREFLIHQQNSDGGFKDRAGKSDLYYTVFGMDTLLAIQSEHHLEKTYTFKTFKEALEFVNIMGHVSEEEGHHPDIFLSWGKVVCKIWTHKVDGLTESDFILAAKIEAEYVSHQG